MIRLAFAALLAPGAQAMAAQRPPLIEQALPLAPALTLRMIEIEMPPAREGPTDTRSQAGHRHTGSTYVYVISGRVASRLGGGQEVVYGPGEAWSERPGEAHFIVNADRNLPARLLVTFVSPSDVSRLTEPIAPEQPTVMR